MSHDPPFCHLERSVTAFKFADIGSDVCGLGHFGLLVSCIRVIFILTIAEAGLRGSLVLMKTPRK